MPKFKLMSSDSFFFLNFINCYEDKDDNGGDVIVIDLIGYDSPHILDQLFLDKLRSGKLDVKDKSKVMRFVVPFSVASTENNEGCNLVKGYGKTTAAAVLEAKKGHVVLSSHLVTPEQGCEHPSINRQGSSLLKLMFILYTSWYTASLEKKNVKRATFRSFTA